MAVTFSFPAAAWARPYVSRRVLVVLVTVTVVFFVLFNFAPNVLPPALAPGTGYSDSSYLSPDRWKPPILSDFKSRPPPEWDADGKCLFLSPYDALSAEEKALTESMEFEQVSPGIVRLKGANSTSAPDNFANPILKLLRDGEAKWNHMLNSQSQTLEQAVQKYQKRWKRQPPKGFDQWWLFARARDALLIDQYDS